MGKLEATGITQKILRSGQRKQTLPEVRQIEALGYKILTSEGTLRSGRKTALGYFIVSPQGKLLNPHAAFASYPEAHEACLAHYATGRAVAAGW